MRLWVGSHTYIEERHVACHVFHRADKVKRIPMIQRAADLEMIWCLRQPMEPAGVQKTNQHMLRGGSLLPEFYDAWAQYFVKFIEAYEAEGLPVWGDHPERADGDPAWNRAFTRRRKSATLKHHLGPAMAEAGYGDKNIVVWDHNRDLSTGPTPSLKTLWPRRTLGDRLSLVRDWTGGAPKYDNLKLIQSRTLTRIAHRRLPRRV